MSPRFCPFEADLVPGRLVRRYKRFLSDITLDDGTDIMAHCPNSGSMMGLDAPDSPVWVRPVDDPKRKLKWTWELTSPDAGRTWVGINTMRPNHVVAWAIAQGLVPGLDPDAGQRAEVAYGDRSRIDLLLTDGAGTRTYVEVKNTTLAEGTTALFPDAVTARGAKHMDELARVVEAGDRAAVVFFVNRADCDRFDVARSIDPTYAAALDRAVDAGVRVIPLGMEASVEGWSVRGVLPWHRTAT